MFTIDELRQRLGSEANFERVSSYRLVSKRAIPGAFEAVVDEPESGPESMRHKVVVLDNLTGKCGCPAAHLDGFCDHIAATALAWLMTETTR